jgi:hypothetical protein
MDIIPLIPGTDDKCDELAGANTMDSWGRFCVKPVSEFETLMIPTVNVEMASGGLINTEVYERIINSKEFIRWFGDLENAKRKVWIIDIDDSVLDIDSKNIRNWGKANITNKEFFNDDTEFSFIISNSGVQKFTSEVHHSNVNLLAHVLKSLDIIIKHALLGYEKVDKIKNLASTSGSVVETIASQPVARFTTNIINLLVKTKLYDLKYLPSQVVDHNILPLILYKKCIQSVEFKPFTWFFSSRTHAHKEINEFNEKLTIHSVFCRMVNPFFINSDIEQVVTPSQFLGSVATEKIRLISDRKKISLWL